MTKYNGSISEDGNLQIQGSIKPELANCNPL
jgi:hypothetical protein